MFAAILGCLILCCGCKSPRPGFPSFLDASQNHSRVAVAGVALTTFRDSSDPENSSPEHNLTQDLELAGLISSSAADALRNRAYDLLPHSPVLSVPGSASAGADWDAFFTEARSVAESLGERKDPFEKKMKVNLSSVNSPPPGEADAWLVVLAHAWYDSAATRGARRQDIATSVPLVVASAVIIAGMAWGGGGLGGAGEDSGFPEIVRASRSLTLRFVLIDPESGQILWYSQRYFKGANPRSRSTIPHAVQETLKHLPRAGQS